MEVDPSPFRFVLNPLLVRGFGFESRVRHRWTRVPRKLTYGKSESFHAVSASMQEQGTTSAWFWEIPV
jgi:hypothetical protein